MTAAVTLPATLRTEADRTAIVETIDADGIEVFAKLLPCGHAAWRCWIMNGLSPSRQVNSLRMIAHGRTLFIAIF